MARRLYRPPAIEVTTSLGTVKVEPYKGKADKPPRRAGPVTVTRYEGTPSPTEQGYRAALPDPRRERDKGMREETRVQGQEHGIRGSLPVVAVALDSEDARQRARVTRLELATLDSARRAEVEKLKPTPKSGGKDGKVKGEIDPLFGWQGAASPLPSRETHLQGPERELQAAPMAVAVQGKERPVWKTDARRARRLEKRKVGGQAIDKGSARASIAGANSIRRK